MGNIGEFGGLYVYVYVWGAHGDEAGGGGEAIMKPSSSA